MLYNEFGWKEYKSKGADRSSLIIAKAYQMFSGMVKLAVIIYVAYVTVYIMSILKYKAQEWDSAVILLIVIVLMSAVGIWGVDKSFTNDLG